MSDKSNDIDDDDDDIEKLIHSSGGGSAYTFKPVNSVRYWYLDLHEEIANPASYVDLKMKLMYEVKENEVVMLHLSNFGGSIHGCINIISGLKNCSGYINVFVDAPCYSAGSVIALCGDSIYFNKNTFLMFHNQSGFSFGKGKELKDSVKEHDTLYESLLKTYCHPFLSHGEVNQILHDKDVYVRADDKNLKVRIKRHFVGMLR